MKCRPTFLQLPLFALAALLPCLLLAAPQRPITGAEIPEPLREWQEWVTWDVPHRNCPSPYHNAGQHLCFWPTRLALDITGEGGRFSAGVTVYHETWVPLPGGAGAWPVEVKANDAIMPVVERGGKPSVLLPAGAVQLEGVFRWTEMPQNLSLPSEIGILALTIDGQPVEAPSWGADGLLWLKRQGSAEEADRDSLTRKVFSLIHDGIPLWLRVEVELVVSGKSREEEIGSVIPEGWKLASIDSAIPVAVDESGHMKAQVRAGRWTIQLAAFRLDTPEEIRYPAGAKPAAPVQYVAFRAVPELRLVEITGAPIVDVTQTAFPEKWRHLPVYQWNTTGAFRMEERMRGMGQQKPPGLEVTRNWWLDDNGKEFTFHDAIRGEMQQIWRLDVAPGQQLGGVRLDEQGQLITRNPATGAAGVELRTRHINLAATGRMERTRALSASGWQMDAETVNVALNLPPGWRLFALFGADRVSGDWLTSWSLLDLFLLLIFTLAVFRLWGIGAAALAFIGFGISYHELFAPQVLWLIPLVPIALLRVVPGGWGRRVLNVWKWGALAVLIAVLVPFVAAQIQQAIYPQLEHSIGYESYDFASRHGGIAAAAAPADESGGASLTASVQEKLNRIVLPKLEFHEATIQEAVEQLNQLAREHDTAEPDPSRRGVAIRLKIEPAFPPVIPGVDEPESAGSLSGARITVSLTNIPLIEALRYVSGLANLKFKIEPDGVSIVPLGTPTDVLMTKEYKVPPGFFDRVGHSSAVGGRLDMAEFLRESGVPFGPGASAVYIPNSSRLVVRNTAENLEMIDTLTEAARQGPPPKLAYNVEARIQTGPGIPEWRWRTVTFGWNGPVTPAQQVHLVLISSTLERILSLLRVALLIALAGVLLDARRLGGRLFSRKQPTAAAALLLFALCSGASSAHAQAPDKTTLNELRERLLTRSDAFPHAADIPFASLTLKGRSLTIEAEIHTATTTAVPLPGRLPAWSPVAVFIDDKPEAALRRDDGWLWVALPAGVHRVRVEGQLADAAEWQWTFQLKPRRVAIDAPGWTVTGVRPGGAPDPQVFFVRAYSTPAAESTYERQDLHSIVQVHRRITLDVVWRIHTTVTRLSPVGKAVAVRIPLLPGEQVVSSSAIVQEGFISVRLGAQETVFMWESALPLSDQITLATTPQDTWIERWQLIASPIWNVAFAGLPPIFEASSGPLTPVWQPWPGEKVELSISRPEAIAGATVTISKAAHEVTLGRRQRTATLELTVRSSLGEDFHIGLPAAAEITSLKHDGTELPVRQEGGRVIVPLHAADQTISVAWKENAPLGFHARAGEVRLPVESVNVETVLHVPDDRWVLWTHGPLRGPAVRFWGIVVFTLLAGWILGRARFSPLRPIEWMLLALGLTQVSLLAALAVVAWLFLLTWRGRESFRRLPVIGYNVAQVFLILLTAAALVILITAVAEGLLGNPEMFIEGNNSSQHLLRWYQARAQDALPMPGAFTVSDWWYRLLMLLWALWLAAALIRWLRWAWEQFSRGGAFRRGVRKAPAPPPLPSAA